MNEQRLRVLFIDDETRVLRSIDRTLRVNKVPWDSRFVESSVTALQMLENEKFDVVVADLRIPEMDGIELLAHVQRRYPQIVRLVLSGQVGTDDCMRAMHVAHQCIAKPCDIATLRSVIRRVEWARGLVDAGPASTTANHLSCLPSAPQIHVDVCRAIAAQRGLGEIARIIDGDVAVTAKLIQVVNSAFFTQGTKVTSVERALAVLGIDLVRSLLLAVTAFRAFEGSHADAARTEALRVHSGRVAHVARGLVPGALASDAFVAGTLHDIGELVRLSLPPEARDVDHAKIGGFLLALWGISDDMAEAIAYHHDPGAIPDERAQLVDAIHAAEIAVGELEGGEEVIAAAWLARNPPSTLERARALARA